MELYRKVRLACRDGMSERAAARHFGVSRESVRKMLEFSVPPGYRRPGRSCCSNSCRNAYERAAVLITSNLPFDEWTETFGSERLAGALLDRLTHHVHILEMNGESFRLNHSRARGKDPAG